MTQSKPAPRGVRFAPSPTGRFHIGNLRTAWISHRLARELDEPWVVRFEDIDTLRVVAGARERQLEDMAELGLVPDEVVTQSNHHAFHLEAFERARASGELYACDCSRKELREALQGIASAPHSEPPTYSGRCRARSPEERRATDHPTLAWRFRMPATDGSRDFVAARTASADPNKDFTPGYPWACALDDWSGNYRLIVRASDLATSLESQRAIHAWACRTGSTPREYPEVFHAALVTQDDGHRLEKRTAGVTLPELKERGLGPDRLLEIFERSFRKESEPEQLALSRLLGNTGLR